LTTTPTNVALAAPAQPQSWWEKATQPQKDKEGNDIPGTSPLDKLGATASKALNPKPATDIPSLQMPSAPQDTSSMMAPIAQQMFQGGLAQQSQPLSWSLTPYGSGAAGPRAPATAYTPPGYSQGPQIPGLTLNSLGMGSGYYG
jgi:hypothetical protein